MGARGGGTGRSAQRRHRFWVLAVCAGLVIGQPITSGAQSVDGQIPQVQLDQSVREAICQAVRSVQAAFAGFPSVAGILTALLQAFGCSGTTPGTTSTTFAPTTTVVPPTTTSTVGTGTTAPTSSTTLPPCIPNNPVTTTVPCVTTTTAPPG